MTDTLILNADGLPLSIVPLSTLPWTESVKLMFLERGDVLAEYEDWTVRSPSTSIAVPSVFMLRDYVKVSRGVKFSRSNVLLRDNYECQYCGLDASHDHSLLTLDHVLPRFHGGKTKWDNVVAACSSCNLEKAHFMKMQPRIPPKRPSYFELVAKRQSKAVVVPHKSWGEFLGWDPSLVTIKPQKRK